VSYQQVTTMWPVSKLTDLSPSEWRVLAFRANGSGVWHWYIDPSEMHVLSAMRKDEVLVSAHRRDGDGTRLLGKLKDRKK
jgi:hypothetical protein